MGAGSIGAILASQSEKKTRFYTLDFNLKIHPDRVLETLLYSIQVLLRFSI